MGKEIRIRRPSVGDYESAMRHPAKLVLVAYERYIFSDGENFGEVHKAPRGGYYVDWFAWESRKHVETYQQAQMYVLKIVWGY